MDQIISWIEALLSPFMPADAYAKLDFMYNASLIALSAGVLLLALSAVMMIAIVRSAKARSGRNRRAAHG